MRLSKSKIIAFRQCAKRLWLELHAPELRRDTPESLARMRQGNEVGALARALYDPEGIGTVLDPAQGLDRLFDETQRLLPARRPIFEAGFATSRTLVLADVLLPVASGGWRAVEVKSSTAVKDYHQDDSAVQAYTMRTAGLDLDGISVATIDSTWVYRGDGRYDGLLTEHDVTAASLARSGEVGTWVTAASEVAKAATAPAIGTGPHCTDPFPCPFEEHCRAGEPRSQHPVAWLPRVQRRELKDGIAAGLWRDMTELPDELLTDLQRRVRTATVSGTPVFDREGAAKDLARHTGPFGFLDFEAVQTAIPHWAGTRPYQQISFQFSFHKLSERGELEHRVFLDLSGDDPSEAFARSLIEACDTPVVFAYNATFEKQRLADLQLRCPPLAEGLRTIESRIVDLLPVMQRHWYHPDQKGSWSLKAVLPTIAPQLDYKTLDGVRDGGQAVEAYLEAIRSETPAARREDLRRQMLDYCGRDTFALVVLWRFLTGTPDG